jgi:hypothetical protein
MKKWISRLVGCFFLTWALSEFIGLLTGTRSVKGFYGFVSNAFIRGIPERVDVAAWIGVIILAWTGYYLIRLEEWGRRLALILLWPCLIGNSLLFILYAIGSINSILFDDPISVTIRLFNFNWPGEMDKPFIILSFFGGLLFFYGIIVYFLSRKDIKILFQKPETPQNPLG